MRSLPDRIRIAALTLKEHEPTPTVEQLADALALACHDAQRAYYEQGLDLDAKRRARDTVQRAYEAALLKLPATASLVDTDWLADDLVRVTLDNGERFELRVVERRDSAIDVARFGAEREFVAEGPMSAAARKWLAENEGELEAEFEAGKVEWS